MSDKQKLTGFVSVVCLVGVVSWFLSGNLQEKSVKEATPEKDEGLFVISLEDRIKTLEERQNIIARGEVKKCEICGDIIWGTPCELGTLDGNWVAKSRPSGFYWAGLKHKADICTECAGKDAGYLGYLYEKNKKGDKK